MTDAHRSRYKELRATFDNAEDHYLTTLTAFRDAEQRLESARADYDNIRRQIFTFVDIISDLAEGK